MRCASPAAAPRCLPAVRRSRAGNGSVRPARCGARASRLRVTAVAADLAPDTKQGAADGLLDVVVVGGGVSGLCIAQALDTKHSAVARRLLVTEARERVGGNITTVTVRAVAHCSTRWALRRRSGPPNDLDTAADTSCRAERHFLSQRPSLPVSCMHSLSGRRGLLVGGGPKQLPGERVTAPRHTHSTAWSQAYDAVYLSRLRQCIIAWLCTPVAGARACSARACGSASQALLTLHISLLCAAEPAHLARRRGRGPEGRARVRGPHRAAVRVVGGSAATSAGGASGATHNEQLCLCTCGETHGWDAHAGPSCVQPHEHHRQDPRRSGCRWPKTRGTRLRGVG